MMQAEINGLRVVVRPFENKDVDGLQANANDRDVWRNLRDRFPHPYLREDAWAWIEFTRNTRPISNFCIEVDGECAGGIGLMMQSDVHRKSGEIGYWLAKKHWGKGIMTQVVAEMTRVFFRDFDVIRIYAMTFAHNAGSGQVLLKAGYEKEACLKRSAIKDGIIYDQYVFAIFSQTDA